MLKACSRLVATLVLVAAWFGPACAATAPQWKGSIYLFSGWVIPFFDSTAGTGIEDISNALRARGVKTEVDNPDYWQTAADQLIASYDPSLPIAVVGYSLGANAALLFCERLEAHNIPVQSLVVMEATQPAPIPTNVAHAVHFYLSSMAVPIRPAQGFAGSVRNVNLAEQHPEAGGLNHWSVSHYREMQNAVLAEILDGDRVKTWDRIAATRPSRYTSAPAQRSRNLRGTGR